MIFAKRESEVEKFLRNEERRMKISRIWGKVSIFLLIPVFIAIPGMILSAEGDQRWEILNPEGVIKIEPMEINPHPSTLEGKTVLLRCRKASWRQIP